MGDGVFHHHHQYQTIVFDLFIAAELDKIHCNKKSTKQNKETVEEIAMEIQKFIHQRNGIVVFVYQTIEMKGLLITD